jgi:ribulose-5-phosphate 4-epimerase/fuculose-1-phosphate aldolase
VSSLQTLLLRNHGFVACGETVEETLQLAFNIVRACETQALQSLSNEWL